MKKILIFLIFTLLPHLVFAQITLKQKIGQMLIIGFRGTELKPADPIVNSLLKQEISGVVLFDYDFPSKTFDRNVKNPTQLRHLTEQLQFYSKKAADRHHNDFYPLFIGIDYEGGYVTRLEEKYGFPKTLSAKRLGKLPLTKVSQFANQMAHTLKTEKINLNFSPVVDVDVNPDNPIIGKKERSFSSDPQQVSRDAEVFTKSFYDHNILCTYKHFPGHGSATTDSHLGFVDITDTWRPYELEPYRQLLNKPKSCQLVMIGHLVNRHLADSPAYPASLSKKMITGLLRRQLHFNGVIITDDLQMKAISNNYGLAEAVRLAINAGADLLVFANEIADKPQDPKEIIDMIYFDVKSGRISEKMIDNAYIRIMRLKKWLRTNVLS